MECQKHLFTLDDSVTYLNGAYMSPLLKSAEIAGYRAMIKKRNPYEYTMVDFFDKVGELKSNFAQIINARAKQIAVIPSTSYGMANVAANLPPQGRSKIIVAGEQFPSNYYVWDRYASDHNGRVEIVNPDSSSTYRGQSWNDNILRAIDDQTIAVAISHVHWADGTLFQLKEIGEKCQYHGAKLIVDGTQSIGVLPFDIEDMSVDVLVASGYKCLMGPYGIGYAYYSESFDDGLPIEDSWVNRKNSDDFARLVDYQPDYREGARRYDMGESSNFIHVAMANAGLIQLLAWGASDVQEYCHSITQDAIIKLRNIGFWVEDEKYRASHLFGVRPPIHIHMDDIKQKLNNENIVVSYRGSALRISPNVYNTSADMDALYEALASL